MMVRQKELFLTLTPTSPYTLTKFMNPPVRNDISVDVRALRFSIIVEESCCLHYVFP